MINAVAVAAAYAAVAVFAGVIVPTAATALDAPAVAAEPVVVTVVTAAPLVSRSASALSAPAAFPLAVLQTF